MDTLFRILLDTLVHGKKEEKENLRRELDAIAMKWSAFVALPLQYLLLRSEDQDFGMISDSEVHLSLILRFHLIPSDDGAAIASVDIEWEELAQRSANVFDSASAPKLRLRFGASFEPRQRFSRVEILHQRSGSASLAIRIISRRQTYPELPRINPKERI